MTLSTPYSLVDPQTEAPADSALQLLNTLLSKRLLRISLAAVVLIAVLQAPAEAASSFDGMKWYEQGSGTVGTNVSGQLVFNDVTDYQAVAALSSTQSLSNVGDIAMKMYRYYATNLAGTNWAVPTVSFTTLPLSPPTAPRFIGVNIDGGTCTVRWLNESNVLYSLFKSTNLLVTWPVTALSSNIPADLSGTNWYADPGATNRAAFYQIKAQW